MYLYSVLSEFAMLYLFYIQLLINYIIIYWFSLMGSYFQQSFYAWLELLLI